ncbi:hypothetical protein ANANG_G00076180 [Anguilla anguilla]|uniref:Desmoplakin spectrin-like domain-containing protein n=1 Tax=Anguilla anguilla TaxID=7936 RepID=A0A9D3MJH4_ANGAN|nr:hypothetical protein ANANG_G00076180 [Anguilla anguilla]
MIIPSVCLLIPPPNPLSINLRGTWDMIEIQMLWVLRRIPPPLRSVSGPTVNEQYYEAILGIWNQLYINIKSLISWQYCLKDISYINSLTITMISKMRPEEYRNIIKSLETHYQEFSRHSKGSDLFVEDDKKLIETQYTGAQTHYDDLVVQLPAYTAASAPKKEEPTEVKEEKEGEKAEETVVKEPAVKLTLLTELQLLRQKIEAADEGVSQHLLLPLGEDGLLECSQRLLQLERIEQEVDLIRDEYLKLKEKILKSLEGMSDSDKVKFLRLELNHINLKLGALEGYSSSHTERMKKQMALLQALMLSDDVIKVYEARLTEKETTSLDPDEVEEYMATLKHMRSELDDKSHIVSKLEAELSDCVAFHTQVGQPCPKCQLDLTKYSELTGQLADRWHRIHSQFDSRLLDLEKYLLELKQYRTTSTSLGDWVDATRQRQDALQSAKFDNVTVLMEHVNQQKALNSEIKEKREVVEDVLKDASRCVASIKDCELQLASYASGLETLLNIPIKRTMLQSPAATVTDEAGDLQARYVGLLANSNDYGKFLAEMLKCMEELKIRNTRIDLLEEELRLIREEMEEKNQKNKSLGDLLAKYQLELTESKDQLLSLEEVKRSKAMECDAAKDDLTATSSQISELNNKLAQLTQMLEEEQRKKRLLEETYKFHQEEYEVIIRKRQKELEEANCAKIDIEKTVKDKEREIERLQMQLENEASRKRELESELSKVRNQYSKEISDLKTTYESEIHITKMHVQTVSKQKEDDSSTLKTQYEELANEKRDLQDELNRLRLSMTEVEAMRRKAEEEVRQQRSAGTEESTMRKELTVQIDTLIKQRGEVELQHKEALAGANRLIQEKNNELTKLTQNLEEEYRKKRALEAEISKLKLALNELQEKYASSVQVIDELKVSSEEVTMVKVELQKQTSERSKVEKSIADLQGRIRDLERMLEAAKAEAESHKKASLEEASRRQRVESELNTVRQSLTEHTTTINLLRKQQEETSTADRRGQQERRGLQESLDKSLRDQKAATEKLAQLSAELEALRQQLAQERARVREANLRNESLSKTMEEKSRALNSNATEIGNLQSLTQKLTKERLTLEEELRALKQELGDLRRSKESSGQETMAQISTLQLQLQNSSKASLEYQRLMEELSKEREKLRLEIDKIQKQATEASMKIQQSQGQHDAILKERDSLLLRMKQMDQDKAKSQKNDEELKRVKVTLESELRLKQSLQEENNKIRKDFEHWKTQYELKEKLVRQYESEKGALEKERNSLKKEVERLLSELKLVEERYKVKLQSTEKEMQSLASLRDSLEAELRRLRQRPDVYHKQTQTEMDTVDTSTLLFDGIRQKVSAHQLHDCRIIDKATLSQLLKGQKTVQEVALDIQLYLKGTGAIAGMDGPEGRMSFTEAKNQDLLTPQSASKLLEAQAATGFIIDPKANEKMAVDVAVTKHLVDFQDRDLLLTAENACTGFKDPSNGKLLSAGQAMKKGWIDWETTLRLLQAQESVGGIVDPVLSVFLTKDAALDRDLIDEELYSALNKRPRCYIDPVTQDDSSYIDLKVKCRTDPATGLLLLSAPQKPIMVKGLRREVSVNELVDSCLLEPSDVDQLRAGLVLLPLHEKKKSTQKNTLRKRRVVIVDPDTNKEMSVKEAYDRQLIDYETYLELTEQECEWEEIAITAPDGSIRYMVIDRKTGIQYDVQDCLEKGLIDKVTFDKYRSKAMNLTQFMDIITSKASPQRPAASTSIEASFSASTQRSAPTQHAGSTQQTSSTQHTSTTQRTTTVQRTSTTQRTSTSKYVSSGQHFRSTQEEPPLSPNSLKHIASISITLASPSEVLDEQSPVGAIFDSDSLEKITIMEALNRGILDSITAQRLLEAQACTGGIIDHTTGKRLSVQEAARQGIIDDDMATKLKPAQKAHLGFEDVKTKRKMSAVEAIKERWLPYGAGQRFLEFQYVTGGLFDPEIGKRRTLQDVVQKGWLDSRAAQKLQDTRHHSKNLTCPKTKLKISYKEAMDNCMVEEGSGLKMLQATSVSSKGISSPYNVSSAPGSRSGSRTGSRRGSIDLSSRYSYNYSFSSRSVS